MLKASIGRRGLEAYVAHECDRFGRIARSENYNTDEIEVTREGQSPDRKIRDWCHYAGQVVHRQKAGRGQLRHGV